MKNCNIQVQRKLRVLLFFMYISFKNACKVTEENGIIETMEYEYDDYGNRSLKAKPKQIHTMV